MSENNDYDFTLILILLFFFLFSEFYIGFLQSRFALQTQFLSKFIKTKLVENQGKLYIYIYCIIS